MRLPTICVSEPITPVTSVFGRISSSTRRSVPLRTPNVWPTVWRRDCRTATAFQVKADFRPTSSRNCAKSNFFVPVFSFYVGAAKAAKSGWHASFRQEPHRNGKGTALSIGRGMLTRTVAVTLADEVEDGPLTLGRQCQRVEAELLAGLQGQQVGALQIGRAHV